MSEIENGRLGLYGTEHSKCNHLMTLGLTDKFSRKKGNESTAEPKCEVADARVSLSASCRDSHSEKPNIIAQTSANVLAVMYK